MIRGTGIEQVSTYFQTLNDIEGSPALELLKVRKRGIYRRIEYFLVGRVLVSRTDNTDSSAKWHKVPKFSVHLE